MAKGETPAEATKPCRVCGEDIRASARKCIHCDSWQDWRGEMGTTTTFLSLVIALISVSGAFVPTMIQAFGPNNSRFVYALQAETPMDVFFFVSNTGDRPGTVISLILTATSGKQVERFEMTVQTPNSKVYRPAVIKPSEATSIQFSKEINPNFADDPVLHHPNNCSVRMLASDFHGQRVPEDLPVDCSRVRLLLLDGQPHGS